MRTLGAEVYESARRTQAWLLAVLGLLVAFSSFWITPASTLPTRWVVVFATMTTVVLVVAADLVYRLFAQVSARLPTVRAAHQVARAPDRGELLLLLAPSPLFSHQTAVSIYTKVDDFEVMIGLGLVATIQANGTIQVCIKQREAAYADVWTSIEHNDKRALEALIVKPSVPLDSRMIGEMA